MTEGQMLNQLFTPEERIVKINLPNGVTYYIGLYEHEYDKAIKEIKAMMKEGKIRGSLYESKIS